MKSEEVNEMFLDDTAGELPPVESKPAGLSLAVLSMSQAPWWVVSISFHGLGILLLTLMTFTACREPQEELTLVGPYYKPPQNQDAVVETPKSTSKFILASDHETPPTDPLSTVASDIVVPPDILEKAKLGEEWQTVDPERPNTHSAFGNPESKIFYAENGFFDKTGGGGTQGDQFADILGTGGGTPGKGGGYGGGEGDGFGASKGSGRGPFGSRDGGGREWIVKRHGGSTGVNSTEEKVTRALAWLANHQEADGRWDAKKYESNEKTDTAVTAMSLLAFLGAGHTEKVGRYKENVRCAVAWLKSKQQANGLVYDSTDAGGHRGVGYPHAIAGMALAEAAGMARIGDTVSAAQRAIDYTVKEHQCGEGYDRLGFRYNAKQAGDLSVTGWYVMQLKSARIAGLHVDQGAFEGIIKFLDSVERKGAGGDKGYGAASVYGYAPGEAHENSAHRLTVIGNLCRNFLGWRKEDLRTSVEWAVEKGGLPDGWGEGKTDLYYWYYGTLCTFQQQDDTWKRWNNAMKKTFIENQRNDGDQLGSWDPVGDFSKEWGRVGQTALSCMCLEVYYRYNLAYK